LRRNFVPAPDFARAFVQAEAPREQTLAQALAGYLQTHHRCRIDARDFADISVPLHLLMRLSCLR